MADGIDQQGTVTGKLIRGGTSRGFYVRDEELPEDEALRDELVLEVYGSPDPLQIDGIGGSKSHTSKLMTMGVPDDGRADVEYDRATVSVTEPIVDWSGNCGNLTSGVGVFAILDDMVAADEPVTELTLYNRSTDTFVTQQIPVSDGEPSVYGDYSIDGVPGTGAKITSTFHEPGGNSTGSLLPSGNAVDTLSVGDETIDVSIVDATNVIVFVRAADMGLRGDELPDELSAMHDFLEKVDRIKLAAAEHVDYDGKPHLAFVSEPTSYDCSIDARVDEAEIDITSRIISLQPHHAYAMSGAMCLATATQISGTIPNEKYDGDASNSVTIGHPKGTLTLDVEMGTTDGEISVESITNYRTARPILDGVAFYRRIGNLREL